MLSTAIAFLSADEKLFFKSPTGAELATSDSLSLLFYALSRNVGGLKPS